MRAARRIGKALRWTFYGALAIALLLALLPVWFPWVLRPLARAYGFRFGTYARISYSRFSATAVTYSNRNVHVSADQVQATIPIAWLWKRRYHDTSIPVIEIANWKLNIIPSTTTNQTSASVHKIFRQTQRILLSVADWIPRGSATNGFIYANSNSYAVPALQLNSARVTAQVEPAITLAADLNQHTLAVASPSNHLHLQIVTHADATGLDILSTNLWFTNQFTLNARFGPASLFPQTAQLRAPQVATELFGKKVTASIKADWLTNHYLVVAEANADEFAFDLHGQGTTNSFLVQSANISGFGVQLTNRENFELTYQPPYLVTASSFDANIDFSQQPFFPGRGQLRGQITAHPDLTLDVRLVGTGLQISNLVANELNLSGTLDVSTRTISAGSLTLRGDTNLAVSAEFAGPITNLTHSGELRAGPVTFPHLKPTSFHVGWKARHLTLDSLSADASSGEATLHLAASGDRNLARIQSLTLEQNGKNQLRLESPVQLSVDGAHIVVEPLALSGDSGRVQLQANVVWPIEGKTTFSLQNLDPRFLDSFTTLNVPNLHITSAAFSGSWNRSPLEYSLALDAHWNRDLQLTADVRGDATGTTIKDLATSSRGQPVGTLSGVLPVTIEPSSDQILQLRLDDPIQLSAQLRPQSYFWDLLTNYVSLTNPIARATIGGTLRAPVAQLDASIAELRFRDAQPEVPSLKNISLDAQITGRTARVDRLIFTVAEQPVAFKAQLPIPENFWNARKLDWRTASAQLEINRARVAGFAPLLRGYLSPQGLLRANLALVPGGKLEGQFTIDGASTRPLPNFGAIQDVELVCDFSGQTARLKSVGSLGGEAIFAVGQIELSPEKWTKGNLPPFSLEITGENIPLSRQVDSVIRADLNVALRSRSNAPPAITGNANLRNSLFLRDLRDLIPGGLASPARRPPYFSIEENPFAQWQLDLHVTGQKFLKLRTPLFNGQISADLNLTGTLKNPLAVGDLTIASGTVKLPFATLPVAQGFVTLSAENPYRPGLFLNAADRAFGYDVKMSITGPVDAPIIQFSSTPPLSSEQVLLMLTAGELPRENTFSFTAEQRAQRLAMFLGRGLLSEFGLGGDASRLTIRSGENITESGRPTYSVEYELTHDWSVIGQYDRFNDFNLMLKWQVYAR